MSLRLVRVVWMLVAAAAVSPLFVVEEASALCRGYRRPPAYHEALQAERRGDLAEAVRLYRVAARFPGQETAWISRAYWRAGRLAAQDARHADAAAHFRAALAAQPSMRAATRGLFHALAAQGRAHEALATYRAMPPAVARRPDLLRAAIRVHLTLRDHAAARQLAEILRQQGQLTRDDEALLRGAGGIRFHAPGTLGRI